MRRRSGEAIALAICSLLATAAAHADDWTEGYLGVGIGADVLSSDVRGELCCESISQSGPVGGDLGLSITAGADYQLNSHFVVGAFVSYDWSNIETTATVSDGFDTISASLLNINQRWTVGGRLGALVTPSTLVYALLGYTWLDLEDISVSAFGMPATFPLPDANGWTTGLGFEQKLGRGLSVRGEYRYTHFGQETLLDDPFIGTIKADAGLHNARLVAAYRFGGSDAGDAPDASVPPARFGGGFYLGGGFGLEALSQDLGLGATFFGGAAGIDGLSTGSFGGTLVAGYDVMIAPRILAGAFASYDFSTADSVISASALRLGISASLPSLDDSWTVGARAGWTVTDDSLLYALVGYTRVSVNDPTIGAGPISFAIPFPDLDGVTIGGGFEKLITANLSLRAEYRYTMLDDERIDLVPGFLGIGIESALHSAKLTATYRFTAGQ